MRPTGKTNPVTLLVLLGLAAFGYWVVFFGPMYLDHLDVRESVDSAYNIYVTHRNEEQAISTVVNKVNTQVGWHLEVDDDGVEEVKPGLGISDENVTVTFDEATGALSVACEYDRVVLLKPTQKRKTLHFYAVKKGKIQR